jgi:hypothetical protein
VYLLVTRWSNISARFSQYIGQARLVHGQKTRDFLSSLLTRWLAKAYQGHRRARIFCVYVKRLCAAIGERDKVDYFLKTRMVRPDELPSISFGTPPRVTVRYFPEYLQSV